MIVIIVHVHQKKINNVQGGIFNTKHFFPWSVVTINFKQ